jgi:hypothetical protein
MLYTLVDSTQQEQSPHHDSAVQKGSLSYYNSHYFYHDYYCYYYYYYCCYYLIINFLNIEILMLNKVGVACQGALKHCPTNKWGTHVLRVLSQKYKKWGTHVLMVLKQISKHVWKKVPGSLYIYLYIFIVWIHPWTLLTTTPCRWTYLYYLALETTPCRGLPPKVS